MTRLNRRAFLATTLLTAASLTSFGAARADERYLDIRPGGNFTPVVIAVAPFAGGGEAAKVTGIIDNNFKRSVYLSPLDPKSFAEPNADPDSPQLPAWKATPAQFLVTGRVERNGDSLVTDFRLWDIGSGQQVAGQQYTTAASNVRRVAHIVSDAIFIRITGEKGWFDSRVVYVDETGSPERRRKRLAIMDQDGGNVKMLTRGDNLVVTPRFSPTSQEIAYMSFADSDPQVLLMNIETGQRQTVGNFPGMTFAPRFSPDGQKVAMSIEEGSASNLFVLDISSRQTTRLTTTQAIDTSPSYSPDGSQIVFESDRGGSQQIYVMGAGGGGAKRISFGDGRYSTPVWSPKGDLVAFTKQAGGQFAIGVMKPDGSGERILTSGFHNEGPTWAPNGLYVMYFRDPGNGGASKIFMSDIFARGEFVVPTPAGASDPAWGPLLA